MPRPRRIDCLHISKTGGMAIKAMVRRHRHAFARRNFIVHNHEFTFADALRADPRAAVFFVVREPVDRFVSGFNSRLRKAMPRAFADWEEGERVAFGRFSTPNQLAEALSSPEPGVRAAAEQAMGAIWHARYPLRYWLDSAEFLERHRGHIWYIGEQRSLAGDIERVKALLKLPAQVRLPEDEVGMHRTPPGYSTELSAQGRKNIEHWYRDDCAIYRWCMQARRELIGDLSGAETIEPVGSETQ